MIKFNITRLGVIMAGTALIATLGACRPDGNTNPSNTPRPLQSGTQGHPWGMPVHCVTMEGPLTPECLAMARAGHAPVCIHEDGNIDGLPCVWTDPDGTGIYYNDSSEYHD